MRFPELLSGANAIVIEDPLAHLPVSAIGEFRRNETIYGPGSAPNALFVVLAGKVKICRETADGRQVVMDVYQTDEFFGESSLLGAPLHELAVALDSVRVMYWNAKDIRELRNRIQSFSLEDIERRLVRALLRFAKRLGVPAANGGVEMIAFTHELISQYVGTSREIVTHYMNALRRKRCLDYSRKSIIVFERELKDLMEQGGLSA